MKRLNTLLLFLGVISLLQAQAPKPEIAFEKKIHDFGDVQEDGGVVAYTFEFTNTGRVPLVIHNVRSSCGCTTPEWTRTPIQPGGKGTLKASFDPRNRPGNFNKTITVTSNAETANETLRIIGRVTPRARTTEDLYPREMGDIRMKSSHLSFTRVEPGSKKEESLEIINTSQQPATITFSRVPAHITIKTEPATLAPGQAGVIKAVFDASKIDDWGFVVDQVFVAINGTQPQDARLSVSATIEEDYSKWSADQISNAPDIQFSETSFDFGEVKEGDVVTHTFKVTNNGKSNLVLRRVRASCGCTASQPDRDVIAPGATANIPVTFNTRGRNGRQNQSITVYSNDPRKSTMLLRISANVTK
ncbi:DUF1573 domain-containing protein [Alkaliflexus imshenetskii]|uniref:DUF1573 domain-containing protein n=1 Tax=Alkaliflexus imshenetskii TaxID=286730 RepID=UPI00047C9FDE|nr:DUF1573 domain-containing protein [Alkaliflexus imshenetskii]